MTETTQTNTANGSVRWIWAVCRSHTDVLPPSIPHLSTRLIDSHLFHSYKEPVQHRHPGRFSLRVNERVMLWAHSRGSQNCWWWDSNKLPKQMNMQHKAGDSDSVPLQYVVGVVARETWNWFRRAVCSPSRAEWQMARVAFCSRAEPPCHEEVCMCGSFDKLSSPAICACTDVYTCARSRTQTLSTRLSKKRFVFPPDPIANAKSITAAASLSVALGQVRSFKVRLNPRGYAFPPKTEGRSWRGVVHMESVTYWLLWWSYCVPYGSV